MVMYVQLFTYIAPADLFALLLLNVQSLISQLLALTISIAPPLPITLLLLNVEPIIFPLVALSQYMAPPSSFAVLLSNIEFVMVTLVVLFWYIAPPFGAVLFMNVHFSMLQSNRSSSQKVHLWQKEVYRPTVA